MAKAYWVVLSLGVLAFGCSDAEAPRVPGSIDIVLGDRQRGAVGETLELPLVVRVTDRHGDAYPDGNVDFTVTSGGAVLNDEWERCANPGEWAGPTPTVSVGTSRDGYAWASVTPTEFGAATVEAQIGDAPIGPVTFTFDVDEPDVTVEIANPYEREVVAGPLRQQDFDVFVKDESGNGVSGASVRWELTSGGGDLRHLGPGCMYEEPTKGVLINRTGIRSVGDLSTGYAGVTFRATAFGITTVTASVVGNQAAQATFTVDATKVEILFYQSDTGESIFLGPERPADVDVSVGATVEWVNERPNARIVSSSNPAGGTSFDSGDLTGGETFQFVPDVAGTWTFMDQVSGAKGTLTVS